MKLIARVTVFAPKLFFKILRKSVLFLELYPKELTKIIQFSKIGGKLKFNFVFDFSNKILLQE